MSQLKIVFAGVGAIAPAHPQAAPFENAGPLQVVFPTATRREATGSPNGGKAYIPVHVVNMFSKLEPRRGTRRADVKRTDGWHIWHPIRERLELAFTGDPYPTKLLYERADTDKHPLPDGDVRYLCDMREIWPQRSQFRPEAVSRRSPAVPEVDGQVIVPYGMVSSQFGGKDRREVAFKPARPDGLADPKIVAPEVVVTINGVTGVEITSQSLDSGRFLDPIAFDLTGNGEIRFGHLDPMDAQRFLTFDGNVHRASRQRIRGIDDDPHGDLGNRDVDFQLYYSLLDGEPDRLGLPTPEFRTRDRGMEANCYSVLVGGGH